jgi:hypothetical protein
VGRRGLAWLWLAGFAGALLLYVLTLTPDLAWQDSGDYQYAAARLDLVRPGDAVRVHPWFLVVAHALAGVPAWNYAYAANLASAIGTALAVANVLLLARLVTGRDGPALVAAVAFAVGHAVWWHAVMAETYGWAAAFLSAEGLCAWAYLERRQARWLLVLWFLNGLAISNHLMAVLSLAVFAVWMLWEFWRRRAPWWVPAAGPACWAVGAAFFWIVAGLEYTRTGDLGQTLQSVLVGQWAGEIFNVSDLPRLLLRTVQYVVLNYPTPLLLVLPVGTVVLLRRRDTFSRLLVALAAVYFAWAARYKVQDQYAFFVPFYAVASVMIGVGAARLLENRGRLAHAAALATALVPVAVYAVLPAAAERWNLVSFARHLPYRDSYAYFLQPWKQGDRSARRFVEEAFASLPARAVLIPDSTSTPPLVCAQQLERQRPDVLIAYGRGAPRETVRRYWAADRNVLAEAAAKGRRVFVVSNHADYRPAWVTVYGRLEAFGSLWEVRPTAREGGP